MPRSPSTWGIVLKRIFTSVQSDHVVTYTQSIATISGSGTREDPRICQ